MVKQLHRSKPTRGIHRNFCTLVISREFAIVNLFFYVREGWAQWEQAHMVAVNLFKKLENLKLHASMVI